MSGSWGNRSGGGGRDDDRGSRGGHGRHDNWDSWGADDWHREGGGGGDRQGKGGGGGDWQGEEPSLSRTLSHHELAAAAWTQGYGKGHADAHAAAQDSYNKGFDAGYARGFEAGAEAGAKRPVAKHDPDAAVGARCPVAEHHPDAASSTGRVKRRKRGAAWQEWNDKYTAANKDTNEPVYMVQLGRKDRNMELYPEQIQTQLREQRLMMASGEASRPIAYDMGGGWLYHVTLIPEKDKHRWEERLSRTCGENQPFVGAQWNANKTTQAPPEVFEDGVSYRPIFIWVKGAGAGDA